MGLKNYQVVVGHARQLALDEAGPHIEMLLDVNGVSCRAIVNARSVQGHDPLLYRCQAPFCHPITSGLKHLVPGVYDLRFHRTDLALDYIRSGVVSRHDMDVASPRQSEPQDGLLKMLLPLLHQAMRDDTVRIYAFGEVLEPALIEGHPSFGLEADSSIHDLHMNQGSAGRFSPENGPLQDGALMFYVQRENRWIAFFLAFQSQVWMTDSQSGAPIASHLPPECIESAQGSTPRRGKQPS